MRAPKQNVKEFLEKRRRATKRVLNEKKQGVGRRRSPQSSGLNGTNMANYMYLTRTGQSVLKSWQCDTNNDKYHNYGQKLRKRSTRDERQKRPQKNSKDQQCKQRRISTLLPEGKQ